MTVRQAKTQISLGIRPVSSESSLCAQWVAKDPSFLHANSEDSDQTGRTCHFVGFVITWLIYSSHDDVTADLVKGTLRLESINNVIYILKTPKPSKLCMFLQ